MKELITGQTASVQRTVTEEFTAAAVGSGSLPVFGTPLYDRPDGGGHLRLCPGGAGGG
ncbi:MAG: hypothetical protein LIO46_00595 [Clostridiales bacterium]|nr:hypothetical protein [Clostridiales bacterium]